MSSFYAPAKKLESVGVVLGGDISAEAGWGKLGYLVGLEEERLEGGQWGLESMGRVREEMVRDLRGEVTVEDKGRKEEQRVVNGEGKRRNSLVVPSLGWSEYVPFVRGLPAGEGGHGEVVVEE